MKKSLFIFIASILICVGVGYVVTYYYIRNQAYELSIGKDFGEVYYYSILTPEQVGKINQLLADISIEEYEKKFQEYKDEYSMLTEYDNIILQEHLDRELDKNTGDYVFGKNYSWIKKDRICELSSRYSGYKEEQIKENMTIYKNVFMALSYTVKYREYVDYVLDNASQLSEIRLFGDEKRKEIAERYDEYSLLGDIKIKAFLYAGFEKLIENPFANLAAFIMLLLCAGACTSYVRNGKKATWDERNGNLLYKFIFVLGISVLFFAEAVAVNETYELSNLGYSVQSVPAFKFCRFEISLKTVLIIGTVLKLLFFYTCFVTVEMILISGKYTIAFIVGGIVFLAEFLFLRGTQFDLLGILHLDRTLSGSYAGMLAYIIVISLIMTVLILCMNIAYRNYLLKERKRAEEKYLTEINEKYNEIRTIKHDMKNHLSAVLLLMNEGKNEEAKKYLKEITGLTDKASDIKKTGLKALDLLLWSKTSQAEANNIDLKMEIEDEYNGIKISEYEMCSVFANILDNAIEVTGKLEEKERHIRLWTARQMDMLCIFCENPYISLEKENGAIVTTKKDKTNHGLGIRQIKRIAEKHGGMVKIEDSDHIFKISVIMNG